MDLLANPVPKAGDCGDRGASLEAMLERLGDFRKRYGMTRIADTTYLDRIGIPTMSAFVPDSPDVLGVYSGKGRSRDEALVSAVLEAVERQVCVRYEPPTVARLPSELQRDIDVRDLGFDGPLDVPLRCVEARNLFTGAPLHVPLGLANPFADRVNFSHWTTNGLAAGSSLIEALYHALFEVVERHRLSLVEIEANVWPRFLQTGIADAHMLPTSMLELPDDPAASEILFPTGDAEIDALGSAILAAGISLRLFAFPDDAWPVTMAACLHEAGTDVPMVHAGTGCSWSPRRAAIAAITEAVSSRVVTIQGAREDLRRKRGPRAANFRTQSRDGLPVGRWFFDLPAPQVRFADIPDRSSDDFCLDIRRVLDVIGSLGVGCVVMVDLSPSDGSVHVVRVVAPGLERFTLDGSISARMQRLLTMSFSA